MFNFQGAWLNGQPPAWTNDGSFGSTPPKVHNCGGSPCTLLNIGNILASGTAPRNQGYLAVWNVADGKLIAAADVATGPIYSFDLAADGVSALIGCGPKNRTAPESDAYIVRIPGK